MTAAANAQNGAVNSRASNANAVESKRFSFWYGKKQALHDKAASTIVVEA